MAYYQLEPWGPERADLNAGIVAATMANLQRQRGRKAYSPSDFMPDYLAASRPESERIASQVREVMEQMGRKIAPKKGRKGATDDGNVQDRGPEGDGKGDA